MIFGTTIPKIENALTSSVTMLLYNSELDPTFMDPNTLEHQSVINGTRNYITFGDYAEFDITINLFKGNVTFSDLKLWDKTDVYLYPHSNGNKVVDKYNEPLLFTIQSINPYYLTQTETYDVAIMKLKSKDYAQYVPLILGGYGQNYGAVYGLGL